MDSAPASAQIRNRRIPHECAARALPDLMVFLQSGGCESSALPVIRSLSRQLRESHFVLSALGMLSSRRSAPPSPTLLTESARPQASPTAFEISHSDDDSAPNRKASARMKLWKPRPAGKSGVTTSPRIRAIIPLISKWPQLSELDQFLARTGRAKALQRDVSVSRIHARR